MADQKTAKIVVKTELESPHKKIQKAFWIAKTAVTVIETASPKKAEEIHWTEKPPGKLVLTDQKTGKTVREISHHYQKAQLIVEKIEQNSKLHSTGKVVAKVYQRRQIVKLKNGNSMSTGNQLPCGQ